MATSNETFTASELLPNTPYKVRLDMSHFLRSQTIGHYYAEYRMTKVELIWQPYYNTFQEGLATNETAPYLYYYVDRTGRADNWDLNDMKDMGIKPIKLVSLTKRSFKPNTLAVIQNNSVGPQPILTGLTPSTVPTVSPAQSVQVQMNKWYSTQYDTSFGEADPTTLLGATAWYGAYFWIDQAVGTANQIGTLEVRAHFEFRGPGLKSQTFPPPSPTVLVTRAKVAQPTTTADIEMLNTA